MCVLARFLYICGNLVGLGNPITNYMPQSGHVVAELVDVLIAVWSMGFAGLAYGLVGALGFVALATTILDDGVSSRLQRMLPARKMFFSLASDDSGMDVDEFLTVAKRFHTHASDAELKKVFASVDLEGVGVIWKGQVGELTAALDAALQKESDDGVRSQQMDEVVKMVSKLSTQVEELKESHAALIAARSDTQLTS